MDCPLPFLQLELKATGDVSPCCYLPTVNLGNLQKQSLESIWNGEKLKSLRREFLSGKIKTCRRPMRQIGCHKNFAYLLPLIEKKEIQTRSPRRLDVRLNGRCNLECVMCEVWKEPNGLYDGTEFWERGTKEIFPQLVEIDVLGGEPFIQKDTFRLIDTIAPANKCCTWGFVTNAHWKWNPSIQERLDRIAIRYLNVSIDSLDPLNYPRIRKLGNLSLTLETLSNLIRYRDERVRLGRGFRLRISMCVQRDNWGEIPQFMQWAKNQAVDLEFQYLTYPSVLSLNSFSESERRPVLALVEQTIRDGAADALALLQSVLIPLRERSA